MATEFLFASFESKMPHSIRKQHIKTLYDLLHISILQFEARRFWKIGLGLILDWGVNNRTHNDRQSLDFLRSSMLKEKESKEEVFVEVILFLIKHRLFREALDELDLYLPVFPYQDNPTLHIYAGAIKLFLAQPDSEQQKDLYAEDLPISIGDLDQVAVEAAQSHFQRACELDLQNTAARSFLLMLKDDEKLKLAEDETLEQIASVDVINHGSPPRKRTKAT